MRRMFSKNQLEELAKQTIENADSLQVFENITDKDGHKRFIEGAITPNATEGLTHKYAKWTLSGSHLMFVDAVKVDSGTSVSAYDIIATITNLPQWIYNKIYPLTEDSDWVAVKNVSGVKNDGTVSSTTADFMLRKVASGFQIYVLSNLVPELDLTFRYELDLLIDNE